MQNRGRQCPKGRRCPGGKPQPEKRSIKDSDREFSFVFCSTLRCIDCAICTGCVTRCPQIFLSNFAGKSLNYIRKLLIKHTEFIACCGGTAAGRRGNDAANYESGYELIPLVIGNRKIVIGRNHHDELWATVDSQLIEKLKVVLATS